MTVIENASRIIEQFELGKREVRSLNSSYDVMIEILFDLSEDHVEQHPCAILRFKNTFSLISAHPETMTLTYLQQIKGALFSASTHITRPWVQTSPSTFERADYRGTNDCVKLYIEDRKIPIKCVTMAEKLVLEAEGDMIPNTLKQFELEIGLT